jgi:hypothetical protein
VTRALASRGACALRSIKFSQTNHRFVMPHHPHIVTYEAAPIIPARAHLSCVIIRRRFPRDVRRESLASCPSGEMESTSFPRERDGVREREFRSTSIAARPHSESESTCIGSGDHLRAFPQSAPKKHFHRTSCVMQPATSRCVCDV